MAGAAEERGGRLGRGGGGGAQAGVEHLNPPLRPRMADEARRNRRVRRNLHGSSRAVPEIRGIQPRGGRGRRGGALSPAPPIRGENPARGPGHGPARFGHDPVHAVVAARAARGARLCPGGAPAWKEPGSARRPRLPPYLVLGPDRPAALDRTGVAEPRMEPVAAAPLSPPAPEDLFPRTGTR